jgi:APA family basic amino acid/polyamine antiporter
MNSTPPHQLPALPRVLGPWMVVAIVVGTVIGTGVFKKARAVSEAVPESGPAIGSWIVVGLLTLCGALALSEVAALFPQAGGNYVFLREAYGRLFGFMWGWVEFWFLRVASCAALSSVFTESLHDVLKLGLGTNDEVLGFWPRQTVAAAVVVALGLLAARGTRLGAGLQFAVTCVKVGSLIAILLLPLIVIAFIADPPTRPDPARFQPVWPADWSSFSLGAFAVAMVAVMWPYNGWSNAAAIAGEVRDPQRNIPRGFIGAVLLLIVLYCSVNASYYLWLRGSEMAEVKDTPVATVVATRALGSFGTLAASAAIMISVFGALAGNMLVGPRGIFALSRDGLAPEALGRVHARYETPAVATLLLTGVTAAFIFAVAGYTRSGWASDPNKPQFDVITEFVVFGAAVFETLAVASIFRFRVTHPPATVKLAYRCPGYPFVPAVFIVCMVAVLGNMFVEEKQRFEALIGLGFIVIGAALYGAFLRQRPAT